MNSAQHPDNFNNFYQLTALDSQLKPVALEGLRDRVLLIVNVASKCGFTGQYKGLEALHRELAPKGLTILAFPCNQFGGQEPGNNEEIKSFCELTYQVSFPLMDKIEVNGTNTHPVYQWLKAAAPGILNTEAVKWNFTKFLVGKNGSSIERFAPQDTPEGLRDKIIKIL